MMEPNTSPGTNEHLNAMLGPPVDIGHIATENDARKLDALGFELYKEAGILVGVVSHLWDEPSNAKGGLPRNQAICAGLLIRIVKFMTVVLQLSANTNRLEVIMALNRCILESSTNLQFLVTKNDPKYFDQFVQYSLAPERELYDTIQQNITKRGGKVWPIETRMSESIERCCRASGMTIQQVDRKQREWGENMRERLKAIGKADQYAAMQRIPSHAIHGTWVDLILNHLDYDDQKDVFTQHSSWSEVDERMFGPMAVTVLDATDAYLEHFFAGIPEAGMLSERLKDLSGRIHRVGMRHEEIIQGK